MALADLTKRVAYGNCTVRQVYGYNNVAVDKYIQFHQKQTVAASDVPAVKGLFAPASAPFSWSFAGGLNLSELLVAVSTTQVNYTATGANTGLDMTIEVDSDCLVSSTNTIVGDLTTGVASLQVWADADGGTKKLLRLDIVNNDSVDVFAVIQSGDASTTTDIQWNQKIIHGGTTYSYFFGREGKIPFRNDAGTVRKGCTIRIAALSAGVLTYPLSINANTDYSIRAIYE